MSITLSSSNLSSKTRIRRRSLLGSVAFVAFGAVFFAACGGGGAGGSSQSQSNNLHTSLTLSNSTLVKTPSPVLGRSGSGSGQSSRAALGIPGMSLSQVLAKDGITEQQLSEYDTYYMGLKYDGFGGDLTALGNNLGSSFPAFVDAVSANAKNISSTATKVSQVFANFSQSLNSARIPTQAQADVASIKSDASTLSRDFTSIADKYVGETQTTLAKSTTTAVLDSFKADFSKLGNDVSNLGTIVPQLPSSATLPPAGTPYISTPPSANG